MTKKEAKSLVVDQILKSEKQIETWQERPYTAVRVSLVIDGHHYEKAGFAKVGWPDAWNSQYGVNLAYHKAVYAIAKQIMAEQLCC